MSISNTMHKLIVENLYNVMLHGNKKITNYWYMQKMYEFYRYYIAQKKTKINDNTLYDSTSMKFKKQN